MKYLFLLLICTPLLFISCGEDDDEVVLFTWDIDFDLELQANSNHFVEITSRFERIPNDVQSLLQVNNLTEADVGQIQILEATLESQDGARFNFMKNFQLDVFNLDDFSDELEIAFREPIEISEGSRLDMFVGTANLTEAGRVKMKRLFFESLIGLKMTYRVEASNPNIRARLILRLRAIE